MNRTPSLDYKTLRKTRGFYAPQWNHATNMGIESNVNLDNSPPIGVVRTKDGEQIAGRFFPIVAESPNGSAILILRHDDDIITMATAVHELCHWVSYCTECQHVPRNQSELVRCRYKGEHDVEFYRRLEPMYRKAEIPTYAARAVEGSYDYPKRWKESEWR